MAKDEAEPPKSASSHTQPQDEAEPPKSVDQGTDEDPLDYRWDGSTWLGPGDWETDPVDIIPGKSEVGGVMKLSHPNDSQQPQDEAEPPKPPTKRQRRSGALSSVPFILSQSQPVGCKYPEDNSSEWHKCWWRESLKAGAYLTQPVDGSQSQQTDGSKSQPIVVDGSQSQ